MLNLEKIYELMKDRYIKNRRQLAKLTNIPYSTLSYMFTGHDMQVGTLIELSRFFNVPIDDLISKSYGIALYTNENSKFTKTSNIYEAVMSTSL